MGLRVAAIPQAQIWPQAQISHLKGPGFHRDGPALACSLCEASAVVGSPHLGYQTVMLPVIKDLRGPFSWLPQLVFCMDSRGSCFIAIFFQVNSGRSNWVTNTLVSTNYPKYFILWQTEGIWDSMRACGIWVDSEHFRNEVQIWRTGDHTRFNFQLCSWLTSAWNGTKRIFRLSVVK